MQLFKVVNVLDKVNESEGKSFIIKTLDKLKGMTYNAFMKFLKSNVSEYFKELESNGISKKVVIDIVNKKLNVNITPSMVLNTKITESVVNEGWWQEASKNFYGAISFYPLLTTFLELDKVIKQTSDADISAMSVYFLIWVAVITGKVALDKTPEKSNLPKEQLQEDIITEGNKEIITKAITGLKNMSSTAAVMFLRNNAMTMLRKMEEYGLDFDDVIDIINRQFKTNYDSVREILLARVNFRRDEAVNWMKIVGIAKKAADYYPLLTSFYEINKLFMEEGLDIKSEIALFVVWIGIISEKISLDGIFNR